MNEVYLVRHAESHANVGDLAFGNRGAGLTDKGIEQAKGLAREFELVRGITPAEYELPVLASTYERTFQTALEAGFREIHRSPLLDESEIYGGIDLGQYRSVVVRHAAENGWIPPEEIERAKELLEAIHSGQLPYTIMFSHGMVIAAMKKLLNARGAGYQFDGVRGFVPRQAEITVVKMPPPRFIGGGVIL